MNLFKRSVDVDSLRGIGVDYQERRPMDASTRRNMMAVDGLHMSSDQNSLGLPPGYSTSLMEDSSDRTNTADFHTTTSMSAEYFSSPSMHAAGSGEVDHRQSGRPIDVARFRSCIIPREEPADNSRAEAASSIPSRDANRNASGSSGHVAMRPAQSGPFNARVLFIVLLFVEVARPATIIAFGTTCRFWRYCADYAPHWTYFRRRHWEHRKVELPRKIRAAVAKPKVVTRDELIAERMKVDWMLRRDALIATAKHYRWCFAIGIMTAVMVASNYVVAYLLGSLRTALYTDTTLGITTFSLMMIMTLLEMALVISPLVGSFNKDTILRVLCWAILLLACSLLFGTITSLAFARVRSTGLVLDGATLNFAMNASCDMYETRNSPSFIFLPAPLDDLRWRPITQDPSGETFVPLCLDEHNSKSCYAMLYFDAYYASEVFHNASVWEREKSAGTRTALGFNPLDDATSAHMVWCRQSTNPQVVAVSLLLYESIAASVAKVYPTISSWMNPALRPQELHDALSYRCGSDINREVTANPPSSANLWFSRSPAWRRNYVPLVSAVMQEREVFRHTHDHFVRYSFACYITSAVLWGLVLLSVSFFRHSAVNVLGMTTTIALLVMNPITMIVTGAFCVNGSKDYFMCNPASGGALIGMGVSLLFLLAALYVSFSK